MTAHRSLILAVFLTVAPFVGGPVVAAQCDSCVLDFTGGSPLTFGADATVGWKFTVTPGSTITIEGLGGNGTSFASASTAGNWQSTPITPLALLPGDYVVGAFYATNDADHLIVGGPPPSTIPGVTWDESRVVRGSSLQFPSTGEGANGYFGPNLFTVAAPPVPEPTSLILLGSGLAALAGRFAWRKRRPKSSA